MPLTIQTLIINGLLDELANVFCSQADADDLLWAIGLPPGSRPAFAAGSPLAFWTDVCGQIDRGRAPGGFEPLLAAAAGRYPGNQRFAPFATMRRSDEDVLLNELAQVFTDQAEATILLAACGFPNAVLPGFATMPSPLAFWRIVVEQIQNGRIAGGFGDLIAHAAGRFPGNQVFTGLLRKPRSGPPPATLGQALATSHDVFISYSTRDRDTVRGLAEALQRSRVSVWFDEWSLPLGRPFVREIQDVLAQVKAVIVCYGTAGYGPWQEAEIEVTFERSVRGQCLLIPVMLPGVTAADLPGFLKRLKGVRADPGAGGAWDDDIVKRLIKAIRDA